MSGSRSRRRDSDSRSLCRRNRSTPLPGCYAVDHSRRRASPRRARGRARRKCGAPSHGAGGARPYLHLSQDLIAVADFDGRFKRVNPAAQDILGYTEEELLARPYVDLVHPADRDSTAAEADALAQGKPTLSFENRYVRKDGSLRVLDWTTTPDVENRLIMEWHAT